MAFFSQLRQSARALLGRTWVYTGTLSAMALMLGTLGMGFFYAGDAAAGRVQCYAGVFNSAAAEAPQGLAPLGEAGEDTLSLPHVRMEYDPIGRMNRMVYVDAAGHPDALPGSRVAEQRVEYDAAGRVVAKRNFDAEGAPVADASGVAVREYARDAAGRVLRTVFRNAAGQAVVPRMPGYAVCESEYDTAGRVLALRYQDAAGKPICNAEGEETVLFTYDDEQGTTLRRNMVGGVLADNRHGIAQERSVRAEGGRLLHRMWLNAAGRSVPHPALGAAAVNEEHAEEQERLQLCDSEGGAGTPRICVERLRRYDADGRTQWECYAAADGLPTNHPRRGYAERCCEYAADGSLRCERFWDAEGNPCPCYEKRHAHNAAGAFELALFTDGSTRVQPEVEGK